MKIRLFLLLLFTLIVISSSSYAITEELFIVTNGPIAIHGGLLRYYTDTAAIRYSYKGLDSGNILVQKITSYMDSDLKEEEMIKLPVESNKAVLNVGSRKISLQLNEYNRVIVRETT